MAEENMSKAQAVKLAYAEASDMKKDGVPPDIIEDTIKKKLVASGFAPEAAAMICSNLPGVRQEIKDSSEQGKKNMTIGLGLFVFGVAVTWISETLNVEKGFGYYIIALGPMLVGLGIFIKGFFDYKSQW